MRLIHNAPIRLSAGSYTQPCPAPQAPFPLSPLIASEAGGLSTGLTLPQAGFGGCGTLLLVLVPVCPVVFYSFVLLVFIL